MTTRARHDRRATAVAGRPRRATRDRGIVDRAPRVERVSVSVSDAGGDCTVRACVRLDALAPSDAVVELIPEDDRGRVRDAPSTRRLWSEQPYGDGRFLYVVGLPLAELGPRFRVCARPVRAAGARGTTTWPEGCQSVALSAHAEGAGFTRL